MSRLGVWSRLAVVRRVLGRHLGRRVGHLEVDLARGLGCLILDCLDAGDTGSTRFTATRITPNVASGRGISKVVAKAENFLDCGDQDFALGRCAG